MNRYDVNETKLPENLSSECLSREQPTTSYNETVGFHRRSEYRQPVSGTEKRHCRHFQNDAALDDGNGFTSILRIEFE